MKALEAPRRAPLVFALALASAGCGDPDQFLPAGQVGGPKGALDGTVVYSGPLPCTEDGHIVGAAVLLVFDVRRLPPPEGLGTQPASLAIVSGEALFAGVRGRLTFNSDKSRWCPATDAQPVTVSATWTAAPLDAGSYQIRAFYDLDGNFDPAFSISNLPTKGDIAGGAIENVIEVLASAQAGMVPPTPPVYRQIALGAVSDSGVRSIPKEGARISGVTVSLGLPLPTERPIFFTKAVLDETKAMNKADGTLRVTMPSDFELASFDVASPEATEKSFIRLTLGAGVSVDPDEAKAAAKSPFNLSTQGSMLGFLYLRQDVDGDGMIDANSGMPTSPVYANDHIPDSKQIPALFPISVFSRLKGDDEPASAAAPAVLIQGLTIYKSLLATAAAPPATIDVLPEVIVAIRPAALCLPADPAKGGVLLLPHRTDATGKALFDETDVKTVLQRQFGRPIELTDGCLPEGNYSLSLIYSTGQAWTVPNEAGVCVKPETLTADGKGCSASSAKNSPTRPRFPSQGAVLAITPPTDAAACSAPLPAACVAPKATP